MSHPADNRPVSAGGAQASELLMEHMPAWLQAAERAVGLGFWSWKRSTNGLVLSAEVYRILGIEPRTGCESAELVGRHVLAEDFERARVWEQEALEGVDHSTIELRILQASGALRWISLSAHVDRSASGDVVGVNGTMRDITHRKDAERALFESEQRLRLLHVLSEATAAASQPEQVMQVAMRVLGEHLGVTRCVFGILDADGDSIFIPTDYTVNCASVAGRHRVSASGMGFLRELSAGRTMIVHDVRTMPGANVEELESIQCRAIIVHSLLRQGKMRALMAVHQSTPRHWTDAEVALVQEVVERCWSTIEQRVAEMRLRESEALLRIASQAARIGGWRIELQPVERWIVSDEALAIIDAAPGEELTRERALRLISPDARENVRGKLARGEPFDLEFSIVSLKGRRLWVRCIAQAERDEHGVLQRVHGAVQDIDDRHKLEGQLRQSQKMEAVGQLAGGVAHDFNNMLSVILSYVAISLTELEPEGELASDLKEIQRAATRAGELTQQLLAFSRQQLRQPRIIDLNETVQDLEKLLRRTVNDDISIALHTSGSPVTVLADPGQIEQVILNLVINARDAMPSGGTVTIETSNVSVGQTYADEGVPSGEYVLLCISDTGIGMSPATRARIFEPFFTTKDKLKGTGLGLSTVHGIVAQSGGHVLVESEPGRGAIFSVFLPRVALPSQVRAPVIAAAPPPRTLRGHETVLVVDDEEQLRTLVCAILRRNGYHVIEAQNSGEAFLICEHHAQPIDLLLTDVIMPRVSGHELAERVALMRPNMRVLFMSGYAEAEIIHRGVIDPHVALIQKPLTPNVLLHKVREVLDGPAAASGSVSTAV